MTRTSAIPRTLLLALLAAGEVGLLVELVLLEHYESVWQWAPLAVLAASLVASVAAWRRPGRRALLLLRMMMAVCIAAGAAGVVLHFLGNRDFALERDPALSGLALVFKVLRGATPALAPGALAQLGLLGLLFTYRHPALHPEYHPDQEIT